MDQLDSRARTALAAPRIATPRVTILPTTTLITTALLAFATAAIAAPDLGIKCHTGKLKESGKYASCRLKAVATGVKKGEPADFAKCVEKFTAKFNDIEADGMGMCPTSLDEPDINLRVVDDTADLATLLSGGSLANCGDGAADADEQCDGVDLDGATCASLGYSAGGVLACDATCGFDTSGCACVDIELMPATGQTTSYGTGDDGDVEAGAPLAYTDNGDGTVTDTNTGLMWEKKVGLTGVANTCFNETGQCANPHHADNRYSWTAGTTAFDGKIVTVYLEQLNNRCSVDPTVPCTTNTDCAGVTGPCGFAGYRDWRIPNAKEMTSILDFGRDAPCVDPVFNGASCGAGCLDVTDPDCSCTFLSVYWTSTNTNDDPTSAWNTNFTRGGRGDDPKTFADFARAVRGGL